MKFLPLILILIALPTRAELPRETYGQLTLDEIPSHTLVINSFSAGTLLFDAQTQQMLGMISTGIGANAFEIDRAKGQMYTAETYLSRHTRGERTDVISIYDIRTLSPLDEIVIPPKHASGSPMRHYSGILTDGDTRLMLVTNITPAVSISVADLDGKRFLTEIPTAGCGLVYPVDGLRFMQLCGDGTAQLITLNKDGEEVSRVRSATFFNLEDDPLMEKPVKTAQGWLFNTFKGKFFRLKVENDNIAVKPAFEINEDDWRVGGMQPLAYYSAGNLLLALMHQGGEDSHKDPGTELWYLDAGSGAIRHRLQLDRPASSVQVSQTNAPLIYAGTVFEDRVDIYDLQSNRHIGHIGELGIPTILQNL